MNDMNLDDLSRLVETAVRVRGKDSPTKGFIEKALRKILDGKETIRYYPDGNPHLMDIARIAEGIIEEATCN